MDTTQPFVDDTAPPAIKFEMLGPAPKHFWGSARACSPCHSVGMWEDDDGHTFRCGYCHGSGIRNGLLNHFEWYRHGQPLGVPVRIEREVNVITQPRLRLAHPDISPKDGLELAFELALQDVCALLKTCVQFDARDVNVGTCGFYGHTESRSPVPSLFDYYYTEYDFPVRVYIEQCRFSFVLSGLAIVVFKRDDALND